MSNGNKKEVDIFGGNEGEDDDIFKSAIESPLTDSDRTMHGDEIDLNDEDEDALGFPPVPKTASLNLSSPEERNKSFLKNGGGGGDNDVGISEGESDRKKEEIQSKIKDSSPEQGQSSSSPQIHSTDMEAKTSAVEASIDLGSTGSTEGDGAQWIEITVTDARKEGDGISGFIVYRVTTRTNIPFFRRKEFAVWRRFSDFLGLHSKLAEKYLKKGRIVPPAPEKSVFTKIKMSSGQTESGGGPQAEFIEKRRSGLERFINRCAAHSILRVDPDFREFLETDSDLPKATNTSAFSGAGVVRLINRFGETVNKISYKMDESDSWFEEKIQNIEALENQLRKVYGSVELLVVNRKDLAQSTGTFAKSAAILSYAEEHTSLSRILSQLAEVEEKVEQMHHDQANSDFFLFCELLKDYVALIGSIKEVFHERVKVYQTWQHAQQTLNKKREAKARLELAVKNDKLGQAREEVVEWEGKVERSQEEFNTISSVIKKELEQFEIARVKEFKKIILKYLESLLHHQQELVKYWEAFLPEFKALEATPS